MALLTAPTIRISSKAAPVDQKEPLVKGGAAGFRRGLLLDP
jgi:hypothetical protein